MLQQPWWMYWGPVIGLAASGFMVLYWVYRLRNEMAEKGWRYTSYSTVFMWILVFFSSLCGLLRNLGFIMTGGSTDFMLLYVNAVLYYIGLAALVTAIVVDLLSRVRRRA